MFHVQESILKLLFDSVISTINAKVAENGELCRDFQSKSWIHTHTQKKTRGIYRPQNRYSRALRKIWMKSKLPWVFRKIKKIEYLGRTKPQQSVWNTRVGGRDVRSGWIESQRSRICLILKFNRASTPSFIAYKEWTDGIQHEAHPKLTVTVCPLCDWKQKEAVL